MSWVEFKERYLRPNYLQLSFAVGALTIGLRVAGANYTFTSTVSIINELQLPIQKLSAASVSAALAVQ
jgi:hypothetical protein